MPAVRVCVYPTANSDKRKLIGSFVFTKISRYGSGRKAINHDHFNYFQRLGACSCSHAVYLFTNAEGVHRFQGHQHLSIRPHTDWLATCPGTFSVSPSDVTPRRYASAPPRRAPLVMHSLNGQAARQRLLPFALQTPQPFREGLFLHVNRPWYTRCVKKHTRQPL